MKARRLFASAGIGLLAIFIVLAIVTQLNSRTILPAIFTGTPELGAKEPPVSSELRQKADELNSLFRQVGKQILPTVVNIQVIEKGQTAVRTFPFDIPLPEEWEDLIPRDFFNFRDTVYSMPMRGQGSGVILTEDGYILTNRHVVHNAEKIKVTLHDQRTFDAEIIGEDQYTDLAVLKIDASGLTPAYLGNSDSVQVGEWVLAVGNPLGLTSTLTAGVVSALTRRVGIMQDRTGLSVENFIQTDAAINPGNSGGGLYNLRGELIGINTAIATRTGYYQGYGFAIPINLARAVAQDLIEDGKVDRGFIGVRISEVDQDMAKALGLDRVRGVIIQEVLPASAGEAAGLKEGDVILSVNGKEVSKPNEVQSIVFQHRAGDKIRLEIFRDGKILQKEVVLKAQQEEEVASGKNTEKSGEKKDSEQVSASVLEIPELGIVVERLSPEQRKQMNVENGVIVTKVDPFGPAGLDGKLITGDVILSANGKAINTPKDLKEVVENSKKDVVLLRVQNGDTRRFVAIKKQKERM